MVSPIPVGKSAQLARDLCQVGKYRLSHTVLLLPCLKVNADNKSCPPRPYGTPSRCPQGSGNRRSSCDRPQSVDEKTTHKGVRP